MTTMQWSDAARSPLKVAAAVESQGEVILERRGESSFVLIRADRAEQARHGMEYSARLLRMMFASGRIDEVEEALLEVFPWSQFLPAEDKRTFAKEFVNIIGACAEIDIWTPIGRMIHEWKQTAIIHAEPGLADKLSGPLDVDPDDDLGPVIMAQPEESGVEEGE